MVVTLGVEVGVGVLVSVGVGVALAETEAVGEIVEEMDCRVGRVVLETVGVMEALEPRVVERVKDALFVLVGVHVDVGVVLRLVVVVAVRVTVEAGEGEALTVCVGEAVMAGVLVLDGVGVGELVAE